MSAPPPPNMKEGYTHSDAKIRNPDRVSLPQHRRPASEKAIKAAERLAARVGQPRKPVLI